MRRLSAPGLLVAAAVAVISGDLCGEAVWGGNLPVALGFFAVAMGLAAWAMVRVPGVGTRGAERLRWVVGVALAVHLVVAVVYCRAAPAGNIDTYTFQTEAARRLVHGVDPFGGTQANAYSAEETAKFYGPGVVRDGRVQVGLQYPPLTVLWVLPGYLLGDIRLSYVVAVMISGVFLFAMAPNGWGCGTALFLLLNPFTWIVENRCWTEPLGLMLLAAAVFAALRRRAWLPVALGLMLAAKQYNVLAVPLAGLLIVPFRWRAWGRMMGLALAVAAATVLPFAVWNARALWHDLVLFHLAQPFRADALSFAVVAPVMLTVGPVLLLVLFAASVWKLRGPAMFAAAYGMAVMVFFATGKQAFANYFFLVAGSWLVAAAALRATTERTDGIVSNA